jgi:uncharacterized protein (TIGR03435 family)
MTFADLSPLANHLWQSTLFAAVAWALTLALRKNRAAVRYGVWLAASVKFLIPFSLLVSAGAQLGWRTVPVIAPPQISFAMDEISQPFAMPAPAPLPAVPVPVQNPAPALLFGVWLCGIAIGIGFWLRPWRQIRALLRAATPLDLNLPIPVMSSPARLEPGVVGVLKPILLLPEGITDHLTPAQLEAILAHELRHVQRRDNLTAAIHMLVETIFWFHPLVWWIRARLMEERERACDEEVVRMGGEPQIYAESILKVCEFYLASPVPCAAGVTGGELKKRIEGIMTNQFARNLSHGKKILLASAAILVIAGPVVVGLVSPRAGRAQAPAAPPALEAASFAANGQDTQALPKFEVASVKPAANCELGRTIDPGSVTLNGLPLKPLLVTAFNVAGDRIQGPSWLDSDCFDIAAKIPSGVSLDKLPLMLQALLAERFKLAAHTEDRQRPGYALVVDKGGPKLKEDDPKVNFLGSHPPGAVMFGAGLHGAFKGVTSMAGLANVFSHEGYGPVQDETGLTGKYDVDLSWVRDPDLAPRPPGAPDIAPSGADAAVPGVDLFAAVRSLGLRLDRQQAHVQFLVVDHIDRLPTAN